MPQSPARMVASGAPSRMVTSGNPLTQSAMVASPSKDRFTKNKDIKDKINKDKDPIGACIQERKDDGSILNVKVKNAKCTLPYQ